MDLQLRGKQALVTASTAGIGLAAAAGLHREGASVVLNGRTPQQVEEAVGKIRGQGGNGEVTGIAADLATAEGVDDLIRRLPEVEILVNNLGILCRPLASATHGAARRVDGGVVRAIV